MRRILIFLGLLILVLATGWLVLEKRAVAAPDGTHLLYTGGLLGQTDPCG